MDGTESDMNYKEEAIPRAISTANTIRTRLLVATNLVERAWESYVQGC